MRRDMTRTQHRPNRGTDGLLEGLIQLLVWAHLDEPQHALVLVLWPTLAHANRVVDAP